MIKNKKELKLAYETIRMFQEVLTQATNPKVAIEYIISKKREIRDYYKRETETTEILVKDYGIDGHLILFELPSYLTSKEEAEEYFNYNEKMVCTPSAYDCTGQAFTDWHKIVERQGKLWAYHSISFDV